MSGVGLIIRPHANSWCSGRCSGETPERRQRDPLFPAPRKWPASSVTSHKRGASRKLACASAAPHGARRCTVRAHRPRAPHHGARLGNIHHAADGQPRVACRGAPRNVPGAPDTQCSPRAIAHVAADRSDAGFTPQSMMCPTRHQTRHLPGRSGRRQVVNNQSAIGSAAAWDSASRCTAKFRCRRSASIRSRRKCRLQLWALRSR